MSQKKVEIFQELIRIVIKPIDSASPGKMGYLEIEGVVVRREPFPVAIIEKIDQGAVLKSQICVEGDSWKCTEIPSCFNGV